MTKNIIICFLFGLVCGLIYSNIKLTNRIAIAEYNLYQQQYIIDYTLPAVGIRGNYFKRAIIKKRR